MQNQQMIPIIPQTLAIIDIPPNEEQDNEQKTNKQKYISCNCKKSKCQKMYCQCFTAGTKCQESCNCIDCSNGINNIIDAVIINESSSNLKLLFAKRNSQIKGCSCMKSNCLKKYCECFQNSVPCTDYCRCQECKNNNMKLLINSNIIQTEKVIKSSEDPLKENLDELDRKIDQRITNILKMVPKHSEEKILQLNDDEKDSSVQMN